MSPTTHVLRLRPSLLPILVTAFAAAMLAVPAARPASAATPTCQGKVATIVGTSGADTLRGTRRADVIVAKAGADTIKARGGRDRICAGGGNDAVLAAGGGDRVAGGGGDDDIAGAVGDDRLRGGKGNDTILGEDGDDTIDGGAGTDACDQGPGTGSVTNCEDSGPPPPGPSADLGVTVKSPRRANSGPITFKVTVVNEGPDASAYTLRLGLTHRRATCDDPAWVGDHVEAELAAAADRAEDFVVTCTKDRKGASVRVTATLLPVLTDPITANDTATSQTNIR
jgi:hemolysin type calcium-binding protein